MKWLVLILLIPCLTGNPVLGENGLLKDVINELANPGCATLASISGAASCMNTFLGKITPFLVKERDTNEAKISETVKYCCALAENRACIFDSVKKICGSEADRKFQSLINTAVKQLGIISNEDLCDGSEFYFQNGSPFCWEESAQVIGGIGLVVLALLCCMCCCCTVRRSRKPRYRNMKNINYELH